MNKMNKNVYERRIEKLKVMIEVAEWDFVDYEEKFGIDDVRTQNMFGRLTGLKDAYKIMSGELDRYLDV